MPASNGGRSGGNHKKKDGGLMENLRGACPPHKKKDFDKLVKTMNGDETKIMAKIQEWWEMSPREEEVWEDVNKKTVKKKQNQGGGGNRGGGRSQGPGRGRGRGSGGGRGAGGRDRGGRGRGGEKKQAAASQTAKSVEHAAAKKSEPNDDGQPGTVPPVATARAPKGAWGARAPMATASASAEPAESSPQPKPEDSTPPPESNPLDVGMVSHSDPTPSGLSSSMDSTSMKVPAPSSSNVWATKGSAHLIQAAKPKPPAPAPVPVAPAPPVKPLEPQPPTPPTPSEPALESGLPSAVSAGGAWSKGAPTSKPPPPSPGAPKIIPNSIPSVSSVEAPIPVSPEQAAPVAPGPAAPPNVLNMGHWETGDADDAQNIDFAFGSFGTDSDTADATSAVPVGSPAAAREADATAATSVSPARPPPGLSLGGMPPMPDAVMVHELENKMESASLNSAPVKEKQEDKPSLPQESATPVPVLPSGGVTQQNYNQYGMPGMYNYNAAAAAAGNGFVGIHTPTGPVLAGGVVPQQHGKHQGGGIAGPSGAGATQAIPQQGLYGSLPPAASAPGNVTGTDSATADTANPTAATAGIPPGMPGAIPYANPALHYGQHQFYMGQHQGGIGYNYPYGQFGGVAQGGFGYQQVMGQNQGYGAPHYDDQSHQGSSHHSGGSGGYQKNAGGGYRGRNSHHNNNQYQNQYNPQQHGGYGGQPYSMGYQDHFTQRAGYGPGGMGDPYNMQQGSGSYQAGGAHSSGNFQDDEQRGKKGGRGNGNGNSTLQQFQQQAPPSGFGLPGQGSESTPSATAGAGGWSNQPGGWSGSGAPSWQGS
eukprot:scaffold25699_cov137-Cylindrotheca_fusiformis.AAC.14